MFPENFALAFTQLFTPNTKTAPSVRFFYPNRSFLAGIYPAARVPHGTEGLSSRSWNTRLPCGIRERLGRNQERRNAPREAAECRVRAPPPRQPHPLTSMETRHPCMALNPKCSGRGPSPAPSPELFTVLGCDK